jgi:hypothetical protein
MYRNSTYIATNLSTIRFAFVVLFDLKNKSAITLKNIMRLNKATLMETDE